MKRTLITLALLIWTAAALWGDERLLINAEINGKPALFAFDTGAEPLLLFPKAVERFGLKTVGPPPDEKESPGRVPTGITEACDLSLWGSTVRTPFKTLDLPSYADRDIDGILGWLPFRDNIFLIDALNHEIKLLARLPKAAAGWTKIPVHKSSPVLTLEIPGAKGAHTIVLVDTGSDNGVKLSPEKWQAWQTAHAQQPTTLNAFYMPAAGLVVKEEAWADELSLGPIRLTQVPVMEANIAEIAAAQTSQFAASVGLAALKRLDFIVDGKHGLVYLKPKRTDPPPYPHNQLGAVFVPPDPESNDLVAHVLDRTPAQEAGIRNGDLLLKIDSLDVTNWRTDPAVLPLSRFWQRPAGTKLNLTLKRGQETFRANATLRLLLAPSKGSSSASDKPSSKQRS